jgi:hypothetical protein
MCLTNYKEVKNVSFNIDLDGMLTTASSIFNALVPIFGPVLGISLGIGLLTLVVAEVRKIV